MLFKFDAEVYIMAIRTLFQCAMARDECVPCTPIIKRKEEETISTILDLTRKGGGLIFILGDYYNFT